MLFSHWERKFIALLCSYMDCRSMWLAGIYVESMDRLACVEHFWKGEHKKLVSSGEMN